MARGIKYSELETKVKQLFEVSWHSRNTMEKTIKARENCGNKDRVQIRLSSPSQTYVENPIFIPTQRKQEQAELSLTPQIIFCAESNENHIWMGFMAELIIPQLEKQGILVFSNVPAQPKYKLSV